VVVGAGPAGIAAACRAAEEGADTLLLDENQAPGGQIWRRGTGTPPPAARRWLERLERSGARVERGLAVWDARSGILSVDRAAGGRPLGQEGGTYEVGPCEVGWERLVVTTGARELFLPFPGWTLPGVLGLGGLQAMAKSGASVAGSRIAVTGSGPLILPVAATLAEKGAELVVVAEQAPGWALRRFAAGLWRSPGKWLQAADLRRRFLATRFRTGTWVASAAGDDALAEVTLTDGRRTWTEPCDLLAASYGLVPNLELARLLGCELADGAVAVDAGQRSSVENVLCAGEVCGIGGVDSALAEGQIAGLVAAGPPGGGGAIEPALLARRHAARRFAARLEAAFAPRRELFERLEPETIVCRCEDVPWSEIDPGWSMRQAKLYRRVGMGPCQGRICGAALERLCGWPPDTVRPPLKPVTAATLARAGDRAGRIAAE
jgi:NADPH-dependent 2,4-dienoyl-CoA reductase/sulfur reductase-like enzyme